MPENQTLKESTHIIDVESGTETDHLMSYDWMFTEGMGGLFPQEVDIAKLSAVLDIGCGPSSWVLDVAQAYPQIMVTGIDMSQTMVQYAQAQASVLELNNTRFEEMDVLRPLIFPNDSFDFVNARFIVGFMPKTVWPALINECKRILRPGGILRLTESDCSYVNGSACDKLNDMIVRTVLAKGETFFSDNRTISVVSMLEQLLCKVGFQHVRKAAYAIDFSAGTEAYYNSYQNLMTTFCLLQPCLVKTGITTHHEAEQLYDQAMAELYSDEFCGMWYYLSSWGEKPVPHLTG